MNKNLGVALFALNIAILTSCSDNDNLKTESAVETAKTEFVTNYVNIVEANYNDALTKTKELQSAINDFIAAPDVIKFEAAKEAWLAAREPYGQTEAYRFYGGPIDGSAEGEPEGSINAWPLDEGLIDYVAGGTEGSSKNLIADDTFELTAENIKSFEGGETDITLGYHAIEFLLWGQDITDPIEKKAGQRPFTDYTTKENADRRKQYLKIAIDVLVEDLESVVKQWKPGATYREVFLALSKDDAIGKILTGAAKLSNGELAGERMATAVINQDQEDEHSCFSDNTHRDVFLNALSINNIINGTYTKVDGTKISGTSLLDVLTLINPTESSSLKSTSDVVMDKVQVISDTKFFDYQIIGETEDNLTKPVMSAVSSLRKQGDELAQAGKTISNNSIDPSV